MRSSVDLPHPLGPNRVVNVPVGNCSVDVAQGFDRRATSAEGLVDGFDRHRNLGWRSSVASASCVHERQLALTGLSTVPS